MIEIKHKETGEVLHAVDADTLVGVDLSNADLRGAYMNGMYLLRTNLDGANLTGADLSSAYLSHSDLTGVELTGSELCRSVLTGTILSGANLIGADLSSTYLRGADLSNADLSNTDLTGARLGDTSLVKCPTLHQAKGLETVIHLSASSLDARTLRACVNHLPDVFLQGVGYNQQEIDYLRSMYATGAMQGGIRYYSCFLSYAHSDNAFVERLRTDLIKNGVNCWKDDDLQTGTKWKDEIDKAISGHEKLVLVCSRRSLYREQVVREILRALDEERSDGSQKFFPVRLDSSIFDDEVMDDAREKVKSGEWRENWVYHIRKYQAADFSQWENEAAYQKALGKLLHDLKNPQKREA